jgi:hypothetical protein
MCHMTLLPVGLLILLRDHGCSVHDVVPSKMETKSNCRARTWTVHIKYAINQTHCQECPLNMDTVAGILSVYDPNPARRMVDDCKCAPGYKSTSVNEIKICTPCEVV